MDIFVACLECSWNYVRLVNETVARETIGVDTDVIACRVSTKGISDSKHVVSIDIRQGRVEHDARTTFKEVYGVGRDSSLGVVVQVCVAVDVDTPRNLVREGEEFHHLKISSNGGKDKDTERSDAVEVDSRRKIC